METLKLHWLGQPFVELKGRPVKLETRKAAAMLAYLSLRPGKCPREVLATIFWPEGSQPKALANLRRTLSSLTSRLPGWIEADRETIILKRNAKLWIDVESFQQLFLQLQEHGHSTEEVCDICLSVLDKAVELYRGDFLEGLNLTDCPNFDDWQFFERDGLRQKFADALQCLSSGYSQRGQWDQAILYARRWVALDRLHEPAYRTVMELYVRAGQRAAALHQYEELVRLLDEQLEQQPEPETRQLFEQIRGREEAQPIKLSSEAPASFPLLKTKLYIPAARASRVIRSALVDRLAEIEQKALTLLSAPAGFGKTTLLAEWITQTSLPVAWLSLDNGDNDPYRFLSYLIEALESIQEDVGREAQQLIESSQLLPPHIILASLINDLGKVAEPYVLVLDDYQFINEHAVHQILSYLLDHLPSNMHLLIATRADPPLQLGRLRAHGQMLELRTQDLRFTSEETTEFLNEAMHLGLAMEDIKALQARTEGWVVGLQMAALSLKGHKNANEFIQAFSGSHRYVLDYLMEEVLKTQPAHIQTFLIQTSILEKLSGSLCDALMTEQWRQAGESGQAVLEYLEKSNLFVIPLDDTKQWYRYHHLFADLLRSRLTQFFMGQFNVLHSQASQWYETNHFPIEAINHAFAAHDTAETIRLIKKHAGDFLFSGGYATVLEWIQRLPPKEVARQPWLCVWFAWGILASGNLDGVDQLIQDAKKGLPNNFSEQAEGISPDNEELLAQILTLEVTLASMQGDHSKTIEVAPQVLERIPDVISSHRINVLFPLGNAYYITGELAKAEEIYREVRELSQHIGYLLRYILATHKLACIQQVMGHLQQSYHLYEELLSLVEQKGKQESFGMGYIYSGMGNLYYEWNHLEDAWQMAARSIRLNEMTRVPMILIDGYNSIVRALITRGDLIAVEQMLEKTAQFIKDYPVLPETKELFESCKVKFWLTKDDMKSLSIWIKDRLSGGIEVLSFERELGDIALARALIAQGSLTEASELVNKLAKVTEAGGRNGRLVEILLLQARILQLQNKHKQALGSLEKSLKLGQSGNYIRIYVDEGEWVEELMRLVLEQENFAEPEFLQYLHDLLDALVKKTEETYTR